MAERPQRARHTTRASKPPSRMTPAASSGACAGSWPDTRRSRGYRGRRQAPPPL